MTPAIPTPETRESHLYLKGAVFPADKLCRHITEEHVKDEIDQIVYADGEKQVVRKQFFAHFADSERLWLIEERYPGGNQTDYKKRHEIIADEENQS
jgi:hypothetical protein